MVICSQISTSGERRAIKEDKHGTVGLAFGDVDTGGSPEHRWEWDYLGDFRKMDPDHHLGSGAAVLVEFAYREG
jgi:hypothetical protein